MLKFYILIYLILLFKVSEVNSGNCCIRPRGTQHHETNITEHAVIEEIEQGNEEAELNEDARFSAEIDKYYETHPETYKGEKETAKELHKRMEEAGPSTINLPTTGVFTILQPQNLFFSSCT
uniref:Uncharacterized protein n=1 Tax=Meloidogyne enterolobii TaxID=390850 RepID=A0A6V7VVH9_MELEN|nr:unnamed protein product [Meloidogyne enterolobii]